MIKINLLPVKARRGKDASQKQLLLILILLVVEAMGLFLIYNSREEELRTRVAANEERRKQIEELKKELGDIEQLKKEKKELEQQEKILKTLEAGRIGPVRALDDLAFIMTPPATSKDRRALEERGANPDWDARRVWLQKFTETNRHVIILGGGRSNDDVAEFVTRLSKSEFFKDVRLIYTKRQQSSEHPSVHYVEFSVEGRMSYTGADESSILAGLKTGKQR